MKQYLPPKIASVYLATEVTVKENGQWISAFDFCVRNDVEIQVITAWNPGDERLSVAQNAERNRQLRVELENSGCAILPALGSDPNSPHSEESWAILGLDEKQAIELGQKYGQIAIFRIDDSRQRVVSCFEKWEVSRSNPIPIGMNEIARWINAPRHRRLLEEHLSNYFGIGDGKIGNQGRQFEWFIQGVEIDSFSSFDILAIGALSVRVPATTARRLIEDAEGTYRVLLSLCRAYEMQNIREPNKSWLWKEGSPFLLLFEKLGTENGVGMVVRSKLMATKFPRLIPIRDSKVEALLSWEKEDAWWLPLHQLLEETLETLVELKVTVESEPSLLRKLDVILWMEASLRQL